MELKWQVNDQQGVREIFPGSNHIHVPVRQGSMISRAEAQLVVPPAPKMFFNGYQTWTYCPEYRPDDRIRGLHGLPRSGINLFALDRLADYHFREYPNRKGAFHGFSYCYFRDGGHYRLFASLDEQPGYTIFSYDAAAGALKIERDCIGTVPSEIIFHAFDLFYAEGSEQEVFDGWFSELGIQSRALKIKGYSSWYNRYRRINEALIREDLAGAGKLFDPGDLFQIDDGWEPFVGDWETPDSRKFSGGLQPVVRDIHAAGLKAGLWLAPFVCEKKSAIFRNHPDWLIQYRGKPWKTGPNWSGSYALDIDHPGVQKYLSDIFRRVFDGWEFDLVKLDFLYAAAPFATGDRGDPQNAPFTESRAGRMIRALTFLRELCGEKLILGCGVPVMPAFGLVDYCRVGCDVSSGWDDLPFMGILHRERVSNRNSLRNTIFRRQLDGRAYGSDPDVFFLRDRNIRLSREEKDYLAAVSMLFGSVWLTSDDLNAYDEIKAARYRELAELRKASDVRIDPDTLTVRFTLDGTEHLLRCPDKWKMKA